MVVDDKAQSVDFTLPVSLQKDFNFTLAYAFPLCVLLCDPNYIGWYYENYIEHFFIIGKEKNFSSGIFDALEYGGLDLIDLRIMDYFYMNTYFATKSNITDNLLHHLNEEYRIVIFLDEYYLPGRSAYKRWHFVHEFLLYGFNEGSHIYYAMAFQNRIFSRLTLTYADVAKAFQSAISWVLERRDCEWIQEKMVIYMKPIKRELPYPFSINRFYTKLCRYNTGTFPSDKLYFKNSYVTHENCRRLTFGIDTATAIREFLVILHEYFKIDREKWILTMQSMYGLIHLFCNHRSGMNKRLQYICMKYACDDQLKKAIAAYSEVERLASIIRFAFLKCIQYYDTGKLDNIEFSMASMENNCTSLYKVEKEILAVITERIPKELSHGDEAYLDIPCI